MTLGNTVVAPVLYVENSTYIYDGFKKLFKNEQASDVQLIAENQSLIAHKLVLCSASELFCRVLCHELLQDASKAVTKEDIKNGKLACFVEMIDDGPKIQLVLPESVKFDDLVHYVQFLYCAAVQVDTNEAKELLKIAKLFECEDMGTYLQNIVDKADEFFNTSISKQNC